MTDSWISSLHVYLTLHNHGLIHPTQLPTLHTFLVLQYGQLQVERVSKQNHEAMAEKIGNGCDKCANYHLFYRTAGSWRLAEHGDRMADGSVNDLSVQTTVFLWGIWVVKQTWASMFFVQNITEPFKRSKPVAVNDTFTFISCFENVNPVNCQDWLLWFKPVLSTS